MRREQVRIIREEERKRRNNKRKREVGKVGVCVKKKKEKRDGEYE